MTGEGVRIRAMSEAELEGVLGWAAEEGWNPGLADAAAFHAADPDGFLVAEAEGAPVAAISVVNHSDDDAFLGLYLCRPGWRGRGIGLFLWRRGLMHAGERTVGLDGVAAQEANYARSGFIWQGATIRFEGRLEGRLEGPGRLRPAEPEDLAQVLALDRGATGIGRERFLASWVAPSPDRQTTVLAGPGARVLGFATARACRLGSKVGPIVAPDAEAAMALAAANPFPGPAAIDVPDANRALIAALAGRGFRETFRTARMYRGRVPQSDHRQQAVATLELG